MISNLLERMSVTVLVPGASNKTVGEVVTSPGIPLMANTGDELPQVLLTDSLTPCGAEFGPHNIIPVSAMDPIDIDNSKMSPLHNVSPIGIQVPAKTALCLKWCCDEGVEELANWDRCSPVNVEKRNFHEAFAHPSSKVLILEPTSWTIVTAQKLCNGWNRICGNRKG